jgi:hypothetical protein
MPVLIDPLGGHVLSSCGGGSLIKVYNIPATYAVNRRKRRDRRKKKSRVQEKGRERERKGEKERKRNG